MSLSARSYILSPTFDFLFIILPAFFCSGVALLFAGYFQSAEPLGLIGWAILVMGVDVSHVWSTIFRTYADKETYQEHKFFLLLLPFLVFLACFFVYALGAKIFWRVMAYLAVYHFVRQQYGFMRIYSRNETMSHADAWIDKITIYAGALFPVLCWHFYGHRNFNWFVDGDFAYYPSPGLLNLTYCGYIAFLSGYIMKEIRLILKNKSVNLARNGLILGTWISWYFSILYFNSDKAFTMINVVSHGIPYMAIVFAYGIKKYRNHNFREQRPFFFYLFSRFGSILFMSILLMIAFAEETLWDVLIWKEPTHYPLFSFFHNMLKAGNLESWFLFFVPLLSVPQITHYVMDGFIWKIRKDSFRWKSITLDKNLT